MGASVADVELMARDVHPAEVAIGDRVIRDVRVFLTSHRLIAFGTLHGKIVPVLDEPLADVGSIPRSRGTMAGGRLEARLASGETAWVNPGAGCGCGSPLKALAAPVPWVR